MPLVPRDWADPFLEQAREDLKAAWALANQSDPVPATLCMLIQIDRIGLS